MNLVSRYRLPLLSVLWICSVCQFCRAGESIFAEKKKELSLILATPVTGDDGKTDKAKVMRQGEALYRFLPDVVKEINSRNAAFANGGAPLANLEDFAVYYLYHPGAGGTVTGLEEEESLGYRTPADGMAEKHADTVFYLTHHPDWQELCDFSHPRFHAFTPTAEGKWFVRCVVGEFPDAEPEEKDGAGAAGEIDLTPLTGLPIDVLALQQLPGRPRLAGVLARTLMLHGFAAKITDLSFVAGAVFSGLHVYACEEFDARALKSCPGIESFTAEECGEVKGLSGFAECKGLRKVAIDALEPGTVLAPLRLPSLQALSLMGGRSGEWFDLEPLRGIGTLRKLCIGVADSSALQGFANLRELEIWGGEGGKLDLSGLRGMKHLSRLRVEAEAVAGLDAVADLPLRSLALPCGTDFTFLAKMKGLERLEVLTGKGTGDLSTLKAAAGIGLKELVVLDLLNSGDYSFLAGFTSLEVLAAPGIKDLTCLTRLPLRELDISYAKAKDYSPLAKLNRLVSLKLVGSRITDLSLLKGLVLLRSLDLRGTRIKDVAPIAGLPLRYLNVVGVIGNPGMQESPAVQKILSRFPAGAPQATETKKR